MEEKIKDSFIDFMKMFKTDPNQRIPDKAFISWMARMGYQEYEKNILFDKVLENLIKDGFLLKEDDWYKLTELGFEKIYYS